MYPTRENRETIEALVRLYRLPGTWHEAPEWVCLEALRGDAALLPRGEASRLPDLTFG